MPVTGSPGQHTDSPGQHTEEAVRSAAPKKPPGVPSWGLVLATTIRLWWQRRLRDLRRPWRALLAVVCVLAVAGVAVAVVMLTGTSTRTASSAAPASAPASSSAPARPQQAQSGHAHGGTANPGAGTATVPAQAAAWAAAQLSPGQAIACDPAMCTALAAHGMARDRLRPLPSPASGAAAASVIAASAATAARLGQDAPVLLASFGSGISGVEVRASYPGGAAAYAAALRSDLASRRVAGTQLLHSGRIQAAAPGTAQLRAGQVDSRVLTMLALLASQRSWRVVAFGDASPGAPTAAAPFRQVVLVSAGGQGGAAGLAGALALVRGQHSAYRAAQASTVRLAGGQTGLRIEFVAPSPLGLLTGTSG
jgi:hypothetical protein